MNGEKPILVVDDELLLVETITYHLEKVGYETARAMDGESGLKTALEVNPRLVILDVMMPHLSGWNVCRTLRAAPEFGSDIPIIIMTARGEPEDRAKSMAAGANDYILKPFGMQDLLKMVERWLTPTSKEMDDTNST